MLLIMTLPLFCQKGIPKIHKLKEKQNKTNLHLGNIWPTKVCPKISKNPPNQVCQSNPKLHVSAKCFLSRPYPSCVKRLYLKSTNSKRNKRKTVILTIFRTPRSKNQQFGRFSFKWGPTFNFRTKPCPHSMYQLSSSIPNNNTSPGLGVGHPSALQRRAKKNNQNEHSKAKIH